jgi:beta-lactamase regulating signal transducer with metallopeptidase domain
MMNLLLDAWAAVMWKACWQGSLVVLAVWLICLAIPSMPARCRCWLWRLAILKFMVVLLLPTLVNLPLLPAPAVAAPIPEVAVQIVTRQVPVSRVEPVEFHPSRTVELPSLRAILAFLWIIGFGWSLARLLVAWNGARRLRKQSRMIDNTPPIEQLAIQARQYGLRTSPALLATEGNGSPMLIGILRPTIVVPAGTLRKLSPPELAMVLGHELAHIRRGDLLWNLAAAAVRAVFFFHPLVWLSQRRLNLAQEVAADELAILRQHHDPVSYGKLLVSVISKIGPSRLIPTMSMGTAGSVHSLTSRLVAMASIGRVSRGIIATSGILLAATVLLGIVPWRLVAAEPKVSENPKEPPKVALPAYRIEPPDVISIEMLKLIPLPPYRAEIFDVLQIRANALPDQPIDNYYIVEAEGTINLGPTYGTVRVSGMTIDEIRATLNKWLRQWLRDPNTSVQLARVSGAQPVTGQYLVGPDGTINLRQYGVVNIAGKTVTEARIALQNHLKQYLDSPDLFVKVAAYNSKVFYVITQEDSSGDEVRRFPATGEERVSDAIRNIGGLSLASSKKIWISRPVPHRSGDQQILSVEWNAVTQEVQAATNYQILPSDRVFVGTPQSPSKAESTPAQTRRSVWEPNMDQQKAIAEIERSGGTVWTYEESPGKPVIGVYFANKRMIVQGVKNGGSPNFAKVVTFRTNKGLLNIEDVAEMHDLRVTQDSDPNVRQNNVTDAGLASLNGLPQVQVVSLWGTQISDAGVDNLKGLTNLTVLDLCETKVTDAGVKTLQRMLPKCKIIPAGTIHQSSVFPDRQSVIDPDRIYDPIPIPPIPRSR